MRVVLDKRHLQHLSRLTLDVERGKGPRHVLDLGHRVGACSEQLQVDLDIVEVGLHLIKTRLDGGVHPLVPLLIDGLQADRINGRANTEAHEQGGADQSERQLLRYLQSWEDVHAYSG